MNTRNVMIGLCLLMSIGLMGCARESGSKSTTRTDTPQSTSSQSSAKNDNLTTERAQKAIDRFMSANAKGAMTIRSGIREIPSENAAVADLVLKDFTSNDGKYYPGNGGGWSGGGEWSTGKVVFSRFTDGKWVLSQVVITHNAKGQSVTYKPDIEVY